ncbi:MAG: hypothetical protein FD174_133 [Geobacteraceae bacterium]|nr:MAG: hypothetical protein FD174_133 [Geobacteraceae bacterium]
MEATREIYWNVGHGVVWPMYLFAIVAIGICAWGFWLRLPVYRLGKPLNRLDQLPRRVALMVRTMLSQSQVLRVLEPGCLHALFFWGFGLLFVGTLLIMAQADFSQPLLGVVFLKGAFYELYSLVLDVAGLAALLMLGGLLVRRFFGKPAGLETIRDDYVVHALLFAILMTGFVAEGVRMSASELALNPELARFSPVGKLVGQLFLGLSAAELSLAHKLLWWVHFILAMGFIAAIPFTKLRHIFATSANYLFADLGPKGGIVTINLEDESIEQFGAAKVADLTWKDIFDADACTSCKRCQDRCPAWNTEKPLSPMKVVQQIGEVAFGRPDASLCETVTEDVLWACTTCRACQEICPADIEHVNKIIEMRRNLTLMEGAFPGDEVRTAINNFEVNGNPFGLAYAARGDWSDGLPVQLMAQDPDVDILYFVGCYASFDKRNQDVAKNFVRICSAAGIRVGILGKEEKCCGEPPRKLGNEYLYQQMAQENIKIIKGYGVKKIVTSCPHCCNTLGRDYQDLGFDVPVEHYTTYIDRLLAEKRLTLKPEQFEFTYHDSCYVGRYLDIFEEPRKVLQAAGGRLTEMDKSGYDSFCCSAGGGRILAEEKLGSRINVARVGMAHATGAPLLVSNCPFCLTMFEDGIKTGGCEGELRVRDLAEIVAERLTI